MNGKFRPHCSMRGFTLLELMTVMVVILILAVMALQAFGSLKGKAERANCASNLRSLYAAASQYVQEQNQWPQIKASPRSQEYTQGWLGALRKYGISEKNWLCPSVQRLMKNPPAFTDKEFRGDYLATPFDDKPRTPHRWPTQPWFVERGDVHGDGNLMVFASGQVKSMKEAIRDMQGRSFELER